MRQSNTPFCQAKLNSCNKNSLHVETYTHSTSEPTPQLISYKAYRLDQKQPVRNRTKTTLAHMQCHSSWNQKSFCYDGIRAFLGWDDPASPPPSRTGRSRTIDTISPPTQSWPNSRVTLQGHSELCFFFFFSKKNLGR